MKDRTGWGVLAERRATRTAGPPPPRPLTWKGGSHLQIFATLSGPPRCDNTPLPMPWGAGYTRPGYAAVLVQGRDRWWGRGASCCGAPASSPIPYHHPRAHHLLGAVVTLLVSPVQGKLFVVHGVAGVEGAGQAGIRAIEDVEGVRYCDFHAPPWWHCGQSRTQ